MIFMYAPLLFLELRKGNYEHQNDAIEFAKKTAFLPDNERITEIAQYYIDHQLAPKESISDFLGDALHLAFSSFYDVDYLLTWNQKHLANVNKLKHLKIINGVLGLKTPEIVTPMQLLY